MKRGPYTWPAMMFVERKRKQPEQRSIRCKEKKMLEYISQLSNADQERMQSVLSQLYRQTFLLERKYDKRAGRLVLNQDYYFCEQHMEFLKDYLDVAGIFIDRIRSWAPSISRDRPCLENGFQACDHLSASAEADL